MKMQDPKQLSNMALFPKDTTFLAQVALALEASKTLDTRRKRDLLSALRRVGKALGTPLSDIPADRRWLREHLARVSAPQLRITNKTWANVLSNVEAALLQAGAAVAPYGKASLMPAWQRLLGELARGNDRGAIGRFCRFCSNRSVVPENVTDDDVAAYRTAVDTFSLTKRPDLTIYYVTTSWNRLAGRQPGWPTRRLAVPCRRRLRSVNLDGLPHTFASDLAAYLATAAQVDFGSSGRRRALSDATIKSHQYIIRRFLADLADSGANLNDIVDLKAMLTPDMFKQGLRQLHKRNHNQLSTAQYTVAATLLGIATRYCNLPESDLKPMRATCNSLRVVNRIMTDKNRARLRPFDDPQNVGLILSLPEALLKEAKAGRSSPKRCARLVEIALAIELLLAAGLRIKNLAYIHLRDNLQRSRATRAGTCHLVINRQDVKNREPIEIELHEDVVRLLNTYLDSYRKVLVQAGNGWLFGARSGDRAVDPVVLARRITTEIRRRTGLTVNVHLFRALIGKLYLERNPGGYEVLRRMLGHRSITTTLQAYTGVESVANAKHFDETIRRLKRETRVRPMRQKRTRKGGRDAS